MGDPFDHERHNTNPHPKYSTLIARAARTTSTDSEISDCSMAMTPQPSSTAVSVGAKGCAGVEGQKQVVDKLEVT